MWAQQMTVPADLNRPGTASGRAAAMTTQHDLDGVALLDSTSRLRLLLVEDSPADGEPVLAMLASQLPDAEVTVASTLHAALAHLAEHRVDVVLADLSGPEGPGAPVVRAVRTAHPETALLVLTDPASNDLAHWALAQGAQDYLLRGQYDGPRLATTLLHALQRSRAETGARSYLGLARGVLDASDAPTCAVDSSSTIIAVNQAWCDFMEHNGGVDELCGVGVNYLDVCDRAAEETGGDGATEAAVVAEGIRHLLAGSSTRFSLDYPCHAPDASRWFNLLVTPAVIGGGQGAVIAHHNITEVHQMQQRVAHQSLHDALTDLPNRALMHDRVEQGLIDSDRHGLGLAVIQVDLHRYHGVNESVGYRGGDEVLVQVARLLQTQLRPGDTLARSSGDEFLVLWRGLDTDGPSEAVASSERLVHALDRPFTVAGESVPVSASAGVVWRTPGQGVEELLQSADAATYQAKRRGAGHVVLFTDELRQASSCRWSLEAELRLALEGNVTQFVVHYQPVVDLTSGQVVAVESLVRWQHPSRGLLGPDQFIPLAESTGLILGLGDWVLDQAIQDAAALTHKGRELDIAVNSSVRQLDARAVAKVRRALETSGLRPGRLVLEVTESAFVEDEKMTATTLEALAQLGVKIAIDDFGTGYSSLLYLRRYPVSTLKIDREFVAGIGQSADDEAICASITSLAAAVGASTVGEGVETMAQYAVLRSLGCQQGQGFLWSPAVPIDEIDAALAACDRVPVAAPRARMSRAPEPLAAEVTTVIADMHAEGASLHTIAAVLNRTVGRHPKGVRWTAGSVARGLQG